MTDSEKPEEPGAGAPWNKTLGFIKPRAITEHRVRPMRVMEIEVVGGPMDGQTIAVEGSVVTIGRADGNDLTLGLDGTVSTRHARIVREGDAFWLEDLGSTNGTYLGEQRIRARTPLGPGTLFRVGYTRLEFSPR